MKYAQLIIAFLFLLVSTTGILAQYPGSGTGTYSGGSLSSNGPNSSNTSNLDSIERSPLTIYRRSLILSSQKEVVDTNNHHQLQLVEPYYRQDFISSNLGSENSASNPIKYRDNNRIGAELGHFQYNVLLASLGLDDVYDVNRSLWSLNYGKGYSISSDNLNIDFYRRFNRDILLNFSYDNYKDNSWLGNQNNRLRNMDLKLYQDNNRGRISYLIFSNTNVEETNSRTLSSGENSNSQLKQLRYEIGNRMLLNDSMYFGKLFLNSTLGYKNEFYSFVDDTVGETEADFYLPISGIGSVDYRNELATLKFANKLIVDNEKFTATVGIDYYNKKHTLLQDTFSYNEVLLNIQYSTNVFRRSKLNANLSYGFVDAANDASIDITIDSPLKIGTNEVSLELSSLSPTLLHRYLSTTQGLVWQNEYSKTNEVVINANQYWNSFALNTGIEISYITNPVLFDANSESIQLNESITSLTLELHRNLNWRFLKSQHSLLVQNISSEYITNPSMQLKGEISTKFSLFKKKLNSTIGLNYVFMPSYSVSSYNPSIGIFYNDRTGAKSGNIILINPYYSFKVDHFNFFVKCNNCLSRAVGNDFRLIRDYNLYDFRIVAGIKWRLLD